MSILDTPYNVRETMGWLWRNMAGIRTGNPCRVVPLTPGSVLNDGVCPSVRIGFLGDIMDMCGRRLQIAPDIHDFLSSCDFLIGNLEATVTTARKPRPTAQRHDETILDAMADLFPPCRTFLSVANNHAGDFAAPVFRQSLLVIEKHGFHTFGHKARPVARINKKIRVMGATMWCNQISPDIVPFSDMERYASSGFFNIAYPHWGYELEAYPRRVTVRTGRDLLRAFDAVIGHHSHTPQPLMSVTQPDRVQLIAFSLGDFCTGLPFDKYRHGIVCRFDIGPDAAGVWNTGAVEWLYTRAHRDIAGGIRVEFRPDEPVRMANRGLYSGKGITAK